MTSKRLGRQTVRLGSPVSVLSYANIGGKQEAQGPLAGYFDELNQDAYFGQKSWEKGESAMQQFALRRAMEKGGTYTGGPGLCAGRGSAESVHRHLL